MASGPALTEELREVHRPFLARARPLYDVSGVPWANRFRRLDETVDLWRALWRGGTSFRGRLLNFDELPPATPPFRPGGPPIWLGGATPAALARTGHRYDGWLPYPPSPGDYRLGLAAIHEAATAAGRSPQAITPALFVSVRVDHTPDGGRSAMDSYARATYGMPLSELSKIQAVITGRPDEVTTRLAAYRTAGARHLVVRLGALGLAAQHDQLEQVAALIALS